MSRYDIADYRGLAVETVSRAFTELRDRQVIVFRTVRQVRLCERNALEELADRLSKLPSPRARHGVRDGEIRRRIRGPAPDLLTPRLE